MKNCFLPHSVALSFRPSVIDVSSLTTDLCMEHASLPTEEFSSKLSGAEPPLSWPLQMTSGHSTDCLVCHDSLPFHILSFPYEAELSPDVRTAAGDSWRQHISCHAHMRTCAPHQLSRAHAHHITRCHNGGSPHKRVSRSRPAERRARGMRTSCAP